MRKLREKATILILQIKADKAKAEVAKTASKGNYHRREELVPKWFHKRNEGSVLPVAIADPVEQANEFEAERKKILSKLGGGPA